MGDGALVLEYERFVRHGARTTFSIAADSSQVENGEIELWMSSEYFDAIDLQNISPQPNEVRDAGDRRIMVFLVEDPSTTLTVELSARPREIIGWISAEAGVVDGPSIAFDQLSYP
ncbi:MAG TPA: hypothetical protein VGR22_09965 [Thermomicrobiales bacterium]|nr:hypothetical protein [Thermomicrobiales bacterium]